MENKISVNVIVGRPKSNKSSREVVAEVQRGEAIPQGDVGAYLVGVFACHPLTGDLQNYDRGKPGQWSHCLYKKKWEAALHGRDDFAGEEKALIIAGAELLKDYDHGWGNKALSQAHVKKMLESWIYG